MAKIPSFEKVILEVLKSADESLTLTTVEKRRFTEFYEMDSKYHQQLFEEALYKLFGAFGLDFKTLSPTNGSSDSDESRKAVENIFQAFGVDLQSDQPDYSLLRNAIDTFQLELPGFIHQLYAQVNTHNATQQQILWELMSRAYIPMLAVNLTEFDQISNRWDKGMPATNFWFLPSLNEDGKLMLPVQKVMRWWLDLLGVGRTRLADMIVKGLKSAKKAPELDQTQFGAIEDNLKTWYTGTSLPSAKKIRDYCSVELAYTGTFTVDKTLSPKEQFQAAFVFVTEQKKLRQPKALFMQLFGISIETLEAVYDAKPVSDENKALLVQRIAERYAQPTPDVLKRRLMLARMVQYGYLELAKKFGVKNPKKNADFTQNSALQLFGFFMSLYAVVDNASKANIHPDSMQPFIAQTAPLFYQYLRYFYEPKPSEYFSEYLGNISYLLKTQPNDGSLKKGVIAHIDCFFENPTEEQINRITEFGRQYFDDIEAHRKEAKEHRRRAVIDNAKVFISHRAFEQLQKLTATVSDFGTISHIWALFEIKPDKENSKCAHGLIQQLQTLADNDEQIFLADLAELFWHTHWNAIKQVDSDKKAAALLDKLEKRKPYSEIYQANLLLQKGRLLTQLHDLAEAQKCYIEALDLDTKHFSIGNRLRYEIVLEGAMVSAVREAHFSKFWKIGQHYDYFQFNPTKELDTKAELKEQFWKHFAYPYQNAKPLDRIKITENDKLISKAIMLALQGKISEFEALLERKFKKKPNKRISDTRADTLLTALIKQINNPQLKDLISIKTFFDKQPNIIEPPSVLESRLNTQVEEQVKAAEKNIKQAIKILLKNEGVNVNHQDFKGQTALQFAALFGDLELVNALLKKDAQVDLCDFMGRTPLMGAVSEEKTEVAELLLEKGANIEKRSANDKMTPLFFAVITGNVEMVQLLLSRGANPKTKNASGHTPLSVLEFILKDMDAHKKWLHSNGFFPKSCLQDYQRLKYFLIV